MKKTWIYLLGLTLSFGIAACGEANTETESETPATEEMEMDDTEEMEESTEEAEEATEEAAAPAATPAAAPVAKATEAAPKAPINKKEAANTSGAMLSDDAPVAVEQPKKAVSATSND